MSKKLFIAEKPSVAQEFAKALKYSFSRKDGYLESDEAVVTWCVGHLVTMSYPEVYDASLKKWSVETLPFLPQTFKYEIIQSAARQFKIVKGLLNRKDVDVIYICTDSGREGEYIYRLVDQMAGVEAKERKRVWIDSQTEEEINRGIREALDWSEYDNLASSAYLRAKEDYLMGINFSRILTLKYGNSISSFLKTDRSVISVGRVMTCVLGMVVRREREIRAFVKTPFYRLIKTVSLGDSSIESEWKAVEGSEYFNSPLLYKENGFKHEEDALKLKNKLMAAEPPVCRVDKITSKQEKKAAPLLYNLAELQNECSKRFKINPDETLKIAQELYEKKLTTYPRTDARVMSTAVAKVIRNNIKGLGNYAPAADFVKEILEHEMYKGIEKSRYVNDKQITDHYAIIPTGQGLGALGSLSSTSAAVYELIVRRFLSVFYPAAVYKKLSLTTIMGTERFFSNYKLLMDPGYLKVAGISRNKSANDEEDHEADASQVEELLKLKKGDVLNVVGIDIKEGETTPPKRYSSGSMILAMENAGQLIEDEELRSQIKGSGIGTSATRAEILKKLVNIKYLNLNKKTQIITPTLNGEMVYDVVDNSIRPLLNPDLTASWEKGLGYVSEGTITNDEYMVKLEDFVRRRVNNVKSLNNQSMLMNLYYKSAAFYKNNM